MGQFQTLLILKWWLSRLGQLSIKDQICYFNEKDIAYTWDKWNPSVGDYPPGRLDFVFFTNSVMSVDNLFVISTEHMSPLLLAQNNLFNNDTDASDHLPVIVDFVLPITINLGIVMVKVIVLIQEQEMDYIVHYRLVNQTVRQN